MRKKDLLTKCHEGNGKIKQSKTRQVRSKEFLVVFSARKIGGSAIQSSQIGQRLIGFVNKIMRNSSLESIDDDSQPVYTVGNVVKATAVETHLDSEGNLPLTLGNYTVDDSAEAWLGGNEFFQRHAVIVGSTGSGKSWTAVKLLEQMAELPATNAIVFAVYGEYSELTGKGFQHIKIAGPNDSKG